MKKFILMSAFAICTFSLFGQSQSVTNNVKPGAIFKIGKTETNSYRHIKFPKPNIILKRGGRLNYDRIEGSLVVVTAINIKKDGTTVVKIKRKDGKRFFGSHRYLAANIDEALQSGELQTD